MCFTIPLKITKIEGNKATLEDGREVSLELLRHKPSVGAFIMAQVNIAVDILSSKEAKTIRAAIKSINTGTRKQENN